MNAELIYDNKKINLNVLTGTNNEIAIDITGLRNDTGLITYDPGYQNTGSCQSAITFIDGEKGILRYRGIPIEQLAEKSSFIEVSYLLIYGKLPNRAERAAFSERLSLNALLHEDMLHYLGNIPPTAHPMALLSNMVNSLSVYYPGFYVEDYNNETFNMMAARLISKIRTIAAFSYKKSIGEPFVYAREDLLYVQNFLNMMFSSPVKSYHLDPDIIRTLEVLLILHADHEQNCSTSTVRLVGSSKVNLYSSICAGICALWGPLHGGANQQVIEMLESVRNSKLSPKECIERSKDKKNPFRLMGFGHRVYRNYDPRAKILKEYAKKLLAKRKVVDPLLDIAMQLEELALSDDYFIERKLYPNVDFYSGFLYRLIGIPTNMFTVMFAMGRMPGWIAHWKEMHDSVPFKIGRPRQLYIGEPLADYVPVDKRK
ncbi:MAG TPA: citrate (Si)-synthase [Lentisphaeria bacterium]|nr:MAG: citrate (Si)-synthase [Lentisphaerae bacterium GWF2_50_93]HCE41996.1 citrate (Si)-synthase [Lentisphaeria bacterium]